MKKRPHHPGSGKVGPLSVSGTAKLSRVAGSGDHDQIQVMSLISSGGSGIGASGACRRNVSLRSRT